MIDSLKDIEENTEDVEKHTEENGKFTAPGCNMYIVLVSMYS